MELKHFYDVYYVIPGETQTQHSLAGKVVQDGPELHVLADYHDYLAGLEHADPVKALRAFEALKRNPYFRVVNRQEYADGLHPDLIPEETVSGDENGTEPQQVEVLPGESVDPVEMRPPSVFEYSHQAMSSPATIEVRSGQVFLNGHLLTDAEHRRILENVRAGAARIRYKKNQAGIAKKESGAGDLVKIEPGLAAALEHLRAATKAGHVPGDALKTLTSELFVDPMVPHMGNKKAYADFLSRPKEGVHIRMDGNDFGSINKIHSFEHGNHAITAMGNAIREAMDETVGKKQGKLFRIGGDEFHAHVPTHEHAARFARAVRSKLEKIPPVGGTHNLSVSMGFGLTPEHADQASIHAKKAKVAQNYHLGQAKTHAHSLVPGSEGAIPLDPEQLPIVKPVEPPKPTAPAANTGSITAQPAANPEPKPQPAPHA